MAEVKKIFVCCTEQSGDNISSNIFKKIKTDNNIIIDGVGGSKSTKYFRKKIVTKTREIELK